MYLGALAAIHDKPGRLRCPIASRIHSGCQIVHVHSVERTRQTLAKSFKRNTWNWVDKIMASFIATGVYVLTSQIDRYYMYVLNISQGSCVYSPR